MNKALLLWLAAWSHAVPDRTSSPPMVTVSVTVERGARTVNATVVSRGAIMTVDRRRLEKLGDTVTMKTPATLVANVESGGLDIAGPADDTWIRVELSSPGTPTQMIAAAPCVRVNFSGGRLLVRGIARSEALAR
jgi:hypothetical protein